MRFILTFTLAIVFNILSAQNLPLGYIKHFETDFSGTTIHKDLLFSPSVDEEIHKGTLQLKEKLEQDSIVQFVPAAVMFIDNNIFGDFISELVFKVNIESTDSTAGAYFIFGLRDRDNYYFVRLNSNGAGFYKMYKGGVSLVSIDSSFVIESGKYTRLRIERSILERSIALNTGTKEIKLSDPNLVMGYFGMGESGSMLLVDKIIVWAPTSLDRPLNIFK